MKRIAILLGTATLLTAEPLPSSLSMQGYTGLINTPNAQVMDEGDIALSFNNQFDNHLRGYDDSRDRNDAQDYVFGVGFLPNFELQGRVKEQHGYIRDLSANVKYQLPQFYEYFPSIAIGVQDLGSEANNYENYYIVADKSYSFLRASIGYGYSNNSRAPRMDGVFGGLEARIAPWISVLGEYDGEEGHAGLRLNMPKEWSEEVRLNATIASNLSDSGHMSFMVNAVIPLQREERYVAGPAAEDTAMQQKSDTVVEKGPGSQAVTKKHTSKKHTSKKNLQKEGELIKTLVDALTEDGLQNITIATHGDVIFVAYENSVYRHNELDAIGSVLRKAIKLSAYYKRFVIQAKKSNVVITSLSGSLTKAKEFYLDPSFESKTAFVASLSESKNHSLDGEVRVRDANPGKYKTHLVVAPKITTFVGTELGVFDYQLLLATAAYWNLYTGLDFSVHYDTPISHSDALDPRTGLFGRSYSDGGWRSIMLNYTLEVAGGFNTLSAGQFMYDYVGVMDQFIYNYEKHTFKVKLGYFEDKDYSSVHKEVYLAKYTYNYAPLDLYLEVQGGKYWYQDTGFGLSAKRFFSDVAISVNYLQTSPEGNFGFSESNNKYISLAIELPLDFRKSKSNGKYLQLQGDTSWRYAQRSTIDRNDGTNTIVPFSGYDPVMDLESEDYLMNRNRMDLGYIKKNAERLLDTF
jgi:hypothetical protein